MLEYDKIDALEGIDASKTDGLCAFIICHYCYFLEIDFKFQPEVSNGCHDLMQKAVNFNDVAIITVKQND